ncbi:hypothetical protein DEO23_02800 [Brachybacterium endophyticum]|uniref:DUF1684 domain-containing protein n=1 Tax=Brachybacterium endophyticum TaxID=2182385 RepID=A0A2U2RP52_9MICO|nr:DUF1684 domain-containing protein [Brachybacterium endophyticum]PWH07575.1 hypothetical protein DEO23_02800 [Brachybacterium endophyticum]
MSAEAWAPADADFVSEWTAWHESHEETRTDRLGILAATGLHWLGRARLRVPGVPGAWAIGANGPVVELGEGEVLTVDGEQLRGTRELTPFLRTGTALLAFVDGGVKGLAEVSRRGNGVMLRPRRADSAYLGSYTGTKAYPADPQWAVTGRFVAAEEPATRRVEAVLPGIEHSFSSPGHIEFTVGERQHRLTAFSGANGTLTVLFRDATSGITTYAASRSLSVAAPAPDGSVVLDFNRSVNLPCAYTDYSTCPVPPQENTLPIAVDAGEKVPGARVESR